MGLIAFLTGKRRSQAPESTPAEIVALVAALREKVEALEDRQVEREATFTELRDAVLRHFKRIQELERRKRGADEENTAKPPGSRAALGMLMAAKFPTGVPQKGE
jgi:predicted  nucleic acid-binding Zn-ribbon protein